MKTLSGKIEIANVKEAVSELIYSRLGGLKYKLLAEKIYKSRGNCELDDNEVGLLKELASPESGFFSNKLSDALLDILEKEE